MSMYCGIDWSERHHDVAAVDHTGTLIAKRRISDGPDGWRELLRLLADSGDTADEPIPVAIETPEGCRSAVFAPLATAVRDQPARGGPLPSAPQRLPCQVRPRRSHDAGQYSSYRRLGPRFPS